METIGKLPNLEYLFLLNSRVEHRCGPNFVSFNVYQTPFSTQFGGYSSAGAPARNSRKRKGSSKLREEEPDRLYVDALGIAAQNRLRVHGDGVPGSAAASSSSAAMSQTVWRGKLRYIGIRHTYAPIPPLRPLRVWKVTVEEAKARKLVPEGASERRRSLRSNKRRKMEEGDWRVAEEGGFTCRLVEIENLREKRRLGDGFFYGMEKFTFEDE